MMVITTISSTKVKPRTREIQARFPAGAALRSRFELPLGIRFAIGRLLIRLGIDCKHILPTPAGGSGVVLIAAQSPLVLAGERIARDLPEQPDFLAVGAVRQLYTLDELFERLRPAVGAGLHGAEISRVAVILIYVDGRVHFFERGPQVALALH